jgi:hypothetical protein
MMSDPPGRMPMGVRIGFRSEVVGQQPGVSMGARRVTTKTKGFGVGCRGGHDSSQFLGRRSCFAVTETKDRETAERHRLSTTCLSTPPSRWVSPRDKNDG